jgi:hypothetical protein
MGFEAQVCLILISRCEAGDASAVLILDLLLTEPEARMRRLGYLSVVGFLALGCSPPEVAPMTPPGVTFPRVQEEGAEALGEKLSQGTIQPSNVAPGATPAENQPQPGPRQELPPN